MRKLIQAGGLFAAAMSFLFLALPVQAGNYARTDDGMIAFSGDNMPACDDPNVLGRIASRFAYRESHFWNSPLTIEQFEKIREVAFRPWGEPFIPRRFCTAVTLASDGHRRVVNYSVRKGLGPIGIGNDVQWCVVGLDPLMVFAPDCRAALP